MNRKEIKKGILVLLVLVVIFAGILTVVSFLDQEKIWNTVHEKKSQSCRSTIEYDGQIYEYNSSLENYLLLGVDKTKEVVLQNTPGTAGEADCIMLLSVNKDTKTISVLQISGDAVTDVDIYDAQGNYSSSARAEISAQYAYGNGKNSSCWAMEKTVSEFLFDLPVEGCISMDLAGISDMNEMVGGVTLTIPEDYTSIDSAFVKGSQITLSAEQSKRYVCGRDEEEPDSNRMNRQAQYIMALISGIRDSADSVTDFYGLYKSVVAPYMNTDMGLDKIWKLTEYSFSRNVQHITEDTSDNEEEMKKIVIDMFFES